MSIITYCPAEGTIEDSQFVERIYCGRSLHPMVTVMFHLKTGKITLQQAFDKYLLYKEVGGSME
jgi:hypothetical protein